MHFEAILEPCHFPSDLRNQEMKLKNLAISDLVLHSNATPLKLNLYFCAAIFTVTMASSILQISSTN